MPAGARLAGDGVLEIAIASKLRSTGGDWRPSPGLWWTVRLR